MRKTATTAAAAAVAAVSLQQRWIEKPIKEPGFFEFHEPESGSRIAYADIHFFLRNPCSAHPETLAALHRPCLPLLVVYKLVAAPPLSASHLCSIYPTIVLRLA